MKKIWIGFIVFFCFLFTGICAEAQEQSDMNRKLGYFDNTRTVLLLPVQFSGNGREASSYVAREMRQIFRYPYYRTLDASEYGGDVMSPSSLPSMAEKSGADIVVMPVITEWSQWVFHRFLFDDGDDILQTRAIIDIYTYKSADGEVRDDRGTYFRTEEESMVRNVYILDDIMKQIYKTFPYRRVPKDVPAVLSGSAIDRTPKAEMKH